MKRLVGGLVLLSLMSISLDLTAGETAITDKEVLDQLVNLRGFIDEQRDFTKASKGLKPVLVQYRSSASKIDGIVQCNLSFDTDALHLSIGGCSLQADGTTISILIKVVYEWTEYVGYTIKSATLTCSDTKVKVADVKNIDGAIIEQLKCGDIVIKEDASGEHAYVVTFKSESGICMTYTDASCVETQSYDKDGDDWVYNSEDKSILPVNEPNASFKPIYCHPIAITDTTGSIKKRLTGLIFNNSPTPMTRTAFRAWLDNLKVETTGLGKLLLSGGVYDSGDEKLIIASYVYKSSSNIYYIAGIDGSGNITSVSNADFDSLFPSGTTTFEDGVNKIN